MAADRLSRGELLAQLAEQVAILHRTSEQMQKLLMLQDEMAYETLEWRFATLDRAITGLVADMIPTVLERRTDDYR